MRMPCSSCTRLEGDAITGRARVLGSKLWINAHRASEPFSRPFAGRLRSASFNFHRWSPTSYSCGHRKFRGSPKSEPDTRRAIAARSARACC
jgi:hypothetical protein